jgi:hypothetical protein
MRRLSENNPPKPLPRNALAFSLVFTIIVASIFGAYLTFTLGKNEQLTITSSIHSACLEEVPANSAITSMANYTFVGTNVTLVNGTQRLFPLGACPQPATPLLYDAVMSIESNASFIAAENGSQYEVDPMDSLGMHESGNFNGTYHNYSVVLFNDYSNQTYYPCGKSFISKTDLGQIQVALDTLPNGTLNFADPVISILPEFELNVWHCPVQSSVIVSSAILYGGSASDATARGTANLSLSLNNPSAPTNITSLDLSVGERNNSLTPLNVTIFQCASSTQCTAISNLSPTVSSVTNFTSPELVFRFSSEIIPGKIYTYVVNFANGQNFSDSLVAR